MLPNFPPPYRSLDPLKLIAENLEEDNVQRLLENRTSLAAVPWKPELGRLRVVAGHHRLAAERGLGELGVWRCEVYSNSEYFNKSGYVPHAIFTATFSRTVWR